MTALEVMKLIMAKPLDTWKDVYIGGYGISNYRLTGDQITFVIELQQDNLIMDLHKRNDRSPLTGMDPLREQITKLTGSDLVKVQDYLKSVEEYFEQQTNNLILSTLNSNYEEGEFEG